MVKRKKIAIVSISLLSLLFIVLLSIALYTIRSNVSNININDTAELDERVVSALDLSDPQKARTVIENMLMNSNDMSPVETLEIQAMLARTYIGTDPVKAVNILMSIAVDSAVTDTLLSNVIQDLYIIYHYSYFKDGISAKNELYTKMFIDTRFSEFAVEGNQGRSFFNLNTYALSLGANAPISQVANAYAFAKNLKWKRYESDAEQERLTRNVLTGYDAGKAYVNYVAAQDLNGSYTPQVLDMLARISGILVFAYPDLYGDEYVSMYTKSLDFWGDNPYGDVLVLDFAKYAALHSVYDDTGWQVAKGYLDDLMKRISLQKSSEALLTLQRDKDRGQNYRESSVVIADHYQVFKDFLLTQGWEESDFDIIRTVYMR